MYDFLPSPTATQYHILGPASAMIYTFPAFTITHTGVLSAAQQVISYELVKSDGSSITAYSSWLTFDSSAPKVTIYSFSAHDAGVYNFKLQAKLSDSFSLTAETTF